MSVPAGGSLYHLDPLRPPEHCPQCAQAGRESKVKQFKIKRSSAGREWVIMCESPECPWPFSVMTQLEAIVKDEDLNETQKRSSSAVGREQKRRREDNVTSSPRRQKSSSSDKAFVESIYTICGLNVNLLPSTVEDENYRESIIGCGNVACSGVAEVKKKDLNHKEEPYFISSDPISSHVEPNNTCVTEKTQCLVRVSRLPPGAVPCPPPPRGLLSSPQLSHTQSLNTNLLSENGFHGCSFSSLSVAPLYGLYDLDDSKEIIDQEETNIETGTEKTLMHLASIEVGSDAMDLTDLLDNARSGSVKLVHEFTREPEQLEPELVSCDLARGCNYVKPSLEMDDALVTAMKTGSGISLDRELRESYSDELDKDPLEDLNSNVVIHIAKEAMINQPTVTDNLLVKKQGSTEVWLTAGSDQVEMAGFRTSCGDGGKTNMLVNDNLQEAGRNWFLWRGCKVNKKFIVCFSDDLEKLVRKWNPPQNSNLDPRIVALKMEKDECVNHENILKKITFFAEIFLKYLYTCNCFPDLNFARLMNILKKYHCLENKQFCLQVDYLINQRKLKHSGRQPTNAQPQSASSKALTDILQPTEYSSVHSTDPLEENTAADDLNYGTGALHRDGFCCVQVTPAAPDSSATVDQEAKCVQFFYINENVGDRVVFPPVLVNTEEEVRYVVALVTEKAQEYDRKHDNKSDKFHQVIQYSTEAAIAKVKLDSSVVKHIKSCFTKRMMKKSKTERLFKQLPKVLDLKLTPKIRSVSSPGQRYNKWDRGDNPSSLEEDIDGELADQDPGKNTDIEEVILTGATCSNFVDVKTIKLTNENATEQIIEINQLLPERLDQNRNEDIVEEDEKYIPVGSDQQVKKEYTNIEEEIRRELEFRVFGGHLPKVRDEMEPCRDQTGPGGGNGVDLSVALDNHKLGAAKYILACSRPGGDMTPLPTPVLWKKRNTKRKKLSIDLEDLDDSDEDEDFQVPSSCNRKGDRPDWKNRRKSRRLSDRQVVVDRYYEAEYHEFGSECKYSWHENQYSDNFESDCPSLSERRGRKEWGACTEMTLSNNREGSNNVQPSVAMP